MKIFLSFILVLTSFSAFAGEKMNLKFMMYYYREYSTDVLPDEFQERLKTAVVDRECWAMGMVNFAKYIKSASNQADVKIMNDLAKEYGYLPEGEAADGIDILVMGQDGNNTTDTVVSFGEPLYFSFKASYEDEEGKCVVLNPAEMFYEVELKKKELKRVGNLDEIVEGIMSLTQPEVQRDDQAPTNVRDDGRFEEGAPGEESAGAALPSRDLSQVSAE